MTVRHILSIDGGGVRALAAAVVLDALDGEFRAAGKTCAVGDCFDLIAGVSSGAIIAATLARLDQNETATIDPESGNSTAPA